METCDGASAIHSSQETNFISPPRLRAMASLGGVIKKVLERLEQERTKPAAIRISVLEPVTFQNHHKKILSEILRILG